jgi:DNA-binding NarL/FixJ family response regulator
MVEWGRRALEEGERCGMPAHAAAGAGLLGLGEAFVGRAPAAREACNRGARLIDAASDDELARCLSAPEWMGLACMYVERFDEAVAFSGRGIAIARSTGQGHRIPVLAVSYGFAATMLGRVAEAVATTDSAVEGARLMDSPFSLAWLLLNASFASWHAGDLVRARRQLLETIERLEALDDSVLEPNARSQLGQVELDAGDHRFAVRTLLESCGGPELPRIGGFWQIFVFESLARAEAAGGRPAEARAAAERAMAAAPALELELTLGVAKRAMAFVLLGEDDAESAAELAQECAAAAQAVGARIEEGRARALAGRAHAAAGRRADALAQLRAAAETFEECRARREEEAARAVLQRLGEVRRPTSRGDEPGGLGALTGRETEIAELVWDRRTNREIAEALFLSTKTVESHLRNIFAKVGVSSRVELAREVERSRVAALT